jgi:serine/threonine protein kinase
LQKNAGFCNLARSPGYEPFVTATIPDFPISLHRFMDSRDHPPADGSEPAPGPDETMLESATEPAVRMLFGRYRVLRTLGSGGMGMVVLARDTRLDTPVAIKIPSDALARDGSALESLRKEVLRGMKLTHPGIVRTYHFEQDEGGAGIVMEYVEGASLHEMKTRQLHGRFDCEEILPWIEQLCGILEYAHGEARIVHRDLKPRNLLVTFAQPGAPQQRIKVADFGVSALISETAALHSKEGHVSGTPVYMSPQQARGERPTHLDDIYALGATIYELLTGQPPFYQGNIAMQIESLAPPPMAQRRVELGVSGMLEIPLAWEKTIGACLAKHPEERPQSAAEVLARVQRSEAPTVRMPGFDGSKNTPKPPASARQWIGVAAAVVVLAGIALALVVNPRDKTKPASATIEIPPIVDPPAPRAGTVFREQIVAATAANPFVNGLGMEFVPVPITGPVAAPSGAAQVLFATMETTVAQYESFLAATGKTRAEPDFTTGPDHPVVNVSWDEASAFCVWLTGSEVAAGRLPERGRYRLPGDHEWSCAIGIGNQEDAAKSAKIKRGALAGIYPWGGAWPPPPAAGNYADAAAKSAGVGTIHLDDYDDGHARTSPVKAFPANALGVHGLGGNAAEWCEDWFDEGNTRTLRGASWADAEEFYLRSSFRGSFDPTQRFAGYGFRCVLEVAPPGE